MATEADDSIPCYFNGKNETELKSSANTSIEGQKFTRRSFKPVTTPDKGLRWCKQLSCLVEFPVDKTRTPLSMIKQEEKVFNICGSVHHAL